MLSAFKRHTGSATCKHSADVAVLKFSVVQLAENTHSGKEWSDDSIDDMLKHTNNTRKQRQYIYTCVCVCVLACVCVCVCVCVRTHVHVYTALFWTDVAPGNIPNRYIDCTHKTLKSKQTDMYGNVAKIESTYLQNASSVQHYRSSPVWTIRQY
jgi:hypothetical protein